MAYVPSRNWGPWQGVAQFSVKDNWDPASTPTTLTISVAALVPKGTRAVGGWFYGAGSAAGLTFSVRRKGSSNEESPLFTQVAGQAIAGTFEVQLDSNYEFDLYASNSGVSGVYVYVTKIACG